MQNKFVGLAKGIKASCEIGGKEYYHPQISIDTKENWKNLQLKLWDWIYQWKLAIVTVLKTRGGYQIFAFSNLYENIDNMDKIITSSPLMEIVDKTWLERRREWMYTCRVVGKWNEEKRMFILKSGFLPEPKGGLTTEDQLQNGIEIVISILKVIKNEQIKRG